MALLFGLAAAALTLWALQWRELAGSWAFAGAAFAAAAALAWRFAPVDTGVLAWDGTRWTWDGRGGELCPALDLGAWLLLRFDTADTGRRAWLALGARGAGASWHGMRAAVYSRRPNDDADPDSESPSAPRMRP